MKNFLTHIILLGVGVGISGCATTPTVKEDRAAIERSRAYLAGVSYELTPSVGVKCKTPDAAGKIAKKEDWKELAARADVCVKEKNWVILNDLTNYMSRTDIDSPWAPYFMSMASEAQGEFSRAMWMINLAEKKTGQAVGLFTYQRGRIYFEMHEISKAMAEIQKALNLEPTLTDGHLFLAEIYHRDLDLDKAADHYKAVLTLDASNYMALTGLAEIRLSQGSGIESATLYTQATQVRPQELQPWVRLGLVYETLQKNQVLALQTYQSLKSSLDSGRIKIRPEFDLNAKIKELEHIVRAPAQASMPANEQKRSLK